MSRRCSASPTRRAQCSRRLHAVINLAPFNWHPRRRAGRYRRAGGEGRLRPFLQPLPCFCLCAYPPLSGWSAQCAAPSCAAGRVQMLHGTIPVTCDDPSAITSPGAALLKLHTGCVLFRWVCLPLGGGGLPNISSWLHSIFPFFPLHFK